MGITELLHYNFNMIIAERRRRHDDVRWFQNLPRLRGKAADKSGTIQVEAQLRRLLRHSRQECPRPRGQARAVVEGGDAARVQDHRATHGDVVAALILRGH